MKKDSIVLIICTTIISASVVFFVLKDNVFKAIPVAVPPTTTLKKAPSTLKINSDYFQKTLKKGDSGEEVKKLKLFINDNFVSDIFYPDNNITFFGTDLENFLFGFQSSNDLSNALILTTFPSSMAW